MTRLYPAIGCLSTGLDTGRKGKRGGEQGSDELFPVRYVSRRFISLIDVFDVYHSQNDSSSLTGRLGNDGLDKVGVPANVSTVLAFGLGRAAATLETMMESRSRKNPALVSRLLYPAKMAQNADGKASNRSSLYSQRCLFKARAQSDGLGI
ncbi:uncharacterized protein CLUP02_03688 [Colletotrichum lupini]|uniref:Uncharacterized protein n=1 Tax=Colletotrichum lupini TaxID=145971 RepID=A0A9Q8SKP2_9PEZI|nr:uncharacterized protein CLUP02_03688 [Colletotrichum lupini]UQC78212.1 hypothetical protein CLUP02_03688 [Colletotrichum lupini]